MIKLLRVNNQKLLRVNNDPTRTGTLRSRFMAGMRQRFETLEKAAVAYALTQDEGVAITTAFVSEFDAFIHQQVASIIFDQNEAVWMRPFAHAGYVAGAKHAQRTLRPKFQDALTELDPAAFRPEIDIIQARNFRMLRGITEVMSLQIREHLSQGVIDGLNPRQVGRVISDRILKIGRTRGEVLAWTETIRAHAEATLDRFEFYGVDSVSGLAELATADDRRVCPICRSIDGRRFSIADAQGIIPVHPRC